MRRLAPERSSDRQLHRANELDALTGILPLERREALAALLTDEDVATLKHLAEKGMGANTLRALASDLGYLEAWALAATGLPLPWPAPDDSPSNSSPTTSGIRPNGKSIPAMACPTPSPHD